MLHLDLHLYHSTCFARPGASPWSPQYTCSIPVLVHMFNLCFSTYFLVKLSKLHFNLHLWHGTHCARPACQRQAPWTSQCLYFNLHLCHGTRRARPGCQGKSPYTCLIPVPVHMLNPSLGTHVKSQFQSICLIPVLKHIFNPRSGAHFLSQSWYTCFICIIKCRPAPMPKHLLHSDLPLVPVTACHRQASGTPTMYTYFI